MKKIAILQSNYLPWKGIFDMMHQVDIFVFLEDVQYTEHDWRNRNIIKTKIGDKWITVPIKNSNRSGQLICEAEIDNRSNWQRKHFNSFQMNYGKTRFFKKYKWILENLYLNNKWTKLSDFNIHAIKLIAKELGINTELIISTSLSVTGKRNTRILNICKKLNADYYLSGPSAKNYIDISKFKQEKVNLEYMKYEYPRYKQLYEPFNHYVTILDLIFNCGPDTPYYIWGWSQDKGKIVYDPI